MKSICRVATFAVIMGTCAVATPVTFTAVLNGASESPPTASAGTGFATVTIDSMLNTLMVVVSFSGLTSGDTAAHIHCCTLLPGLGTAGVATVTPTFTSFPSGVTAGTYSHLFDMTDLGSYNPAFVTANGGTAASAEAVLFAGITSGNAYLNIHTANNPGGEIRGFLVPEPATYGGVGILLVALWIRRRYSRAPA